MNSKHRNIIIIVIFAVVIGGLFLINGIMPDKEVSDAERRPLEQLPAITWEGIEKGSFMTKFEDYALDQFVGRDFFRSMKAYATYYLFGQKDNNNIYVYKGNASKMQFPLKEQSIVGAANKFNSLMQQYFPNNNVYYSVIPDKNFFMASQNGYLDLDYDKMLSLLSENTSGMTYIDIFGELSLDKYYATDIHWKQEEIVGVAEQLAEQMGVIDYIKGIAYDKTVLENFYGVYAGQSAVKLNPDNLTYLTSEKMKDWKVSIFNEKTMQMEETTIYAPDRFNEKDPYDVFLHGANPLITIETGNTSGKELFIFRDSFSSSLAPLLAEGYSKITLIDIRYIKGSLLPNFVDFGEGNDVLFLYGAEVLQNSAMLKI